MLGMMKALVPQLAQMNIRINGLAPGVIETKFSEAVSYQMGLHAGKPVFRFANNITQSDQHFCYSLIRKLISVAEQAGLNI